VKQAWKVAFSVLIEAAELKVGDRLAIEFPVDYDEQVVTSLHLNDADVAVAGPGNEVGIARAGHLPKVKTGFPIFRIKGT
jgi:hypothetical protein